MKTFPFLIAIGLTATLGCRDFGSIKAPVAGGTDDAAVDLVAVDHPAVDARPDVACVLDATCVAPAHGSAACVSGACVLACEGGFKLAGPECQLAPRSCDGLPATCGAGKNDDCCAYDAVPGGRFSRGYDTSEASTQAGVTIVGWQPRGKAEALVSDFSLGRYEVTVGRFRAFLSDYERYLANNPDVGAGGDPRNVKGGWQFGWRMKATLYSQTVAALKANMTAAKCSPKIGAWLDDPTHANDNKPMTCINWYEAFLFCIWDGARLATEAEWNYAAAGGDRQFAYPWGTPAPLAVTSEFANVDRNGGDVYLDDVGIHPMGKALWGHFDLAGNASEFVHDGCGDCTGYPPGETTDPLAIDKNGALPNNVVRGGSYKYPAPRARTAYRLQSADGVSYRYDDLGWRCAMPISNGAPPNPGTGGSTGSGGASGSGGAGGASGSGGGGGGAIDSAPDVMTCGSGQHACSGSAQCFRDDDATHCGGGCMNCPAPGAGVTPTCAAGVCGPPCPNGHFCSGQCVSNDDIHHCGAVVCQDCPAPAGATVSCVAGICHADCEKGHFCNNVCVANDDNACGPNCLACGALPHGKSTCNGSSCVTTCTDAAYHVCGNDCVTNNDVAHCGTRCQACEAPAHGVMGCDGTGCFLQGCQNGFHKCGNQCLDNNSVDSCGSKCDACASDPHGTRSCDGTKCGIVCEADYNSCGGVCHNKADLKFCGPGCFDCSSQGWPLSCNGNSCCNGTRCCVIQPTDPPTCLE